MFAASASSLLLSPPSTAPATEFVKYSLDGREASTVNVVFDNSSRLLWVVPKTAGGTALALDLLQLKFAESGNRPRDNSKLKKLLNSPKVAPAQCLSLYFGDWPWKAHHLAYPSSQVTQFWLEKLNTYITSHPVESNSHIDTWLQRLYTQLKHNHGDKLHIATVLAAFSRDRIWKGFKLLKDLEREDPTLAHIPEHNPSFSDFKSLYLSYLSMWRQDIRGLYRRYSASEVVANPPRLEIPANTPSSRRRSSLAVIGFMTKPPKQPKPPLLAIELDPNVLMSAEAFANFLAASQDRDRVGIKEATSIIAKYDIFAKRRDLDHITLKGFTHYLLSQETSPPHRPSKPSQKMHQPLHDYLIASSHNTYLTGHQLHGESSVSMYAKVLHTGCRCVELDTWDGEDDEPVIYHGYTLTSKIKFKAVIDTIAKHAFAVTPYPLILSLENHCTLPQQKKMAKYMQDAFGDMLLTSNEQEVVWQIPSPEELKYKVLIKHRKIQNILDGTADGGSHIPLSLFKQEGFTCAFPGPDSKRKGSVFYPQPHASSNPSTPNLDASLGTHHSSCPNSPDSKMPGIPMRSKSTEMIYVTDIQSEATVKRPERHTTIPSRPALCRTDSNLSIYTIFEEEKLCSSSLDSGALKRRSRLSFRRKPNSSKQTLSRKLAVPLDGEKEVARLKESFGKIGDISTRQESSEASSDTLTEPRGAESVANVCSTKGQLSKPRLRKVAIVREDTPILSSHKDLMETHEIRIEAPSPVDSDIKATMAPTSVTQAADDNQDPKRAAPVMDTFAMPATIPHEHQRSKSAPSHPTSLSLYQQASLSVPNTTLRRLSSPILGESPREPDVPHVPDLLSPQLPQRSCSFQSALMEKKPVQRQRPKFLNILNLPLLGQRNSYAAPDDDAPVEESQERCDTAEASYDSKDIAKELSDMVVYTEPVKFTGFKGQEQKLTEMYSLSENMAKKAIKKTPQEFLNFNQEHLSRIYPSASRISSSNYDPAFYWMRGCQMVALNYQTNDAPMQHNVTLFKQNAGCGYIPKLHNWKERAEEVLAGSNVNNTQLTITLLSGQYLVSQGYYLPAVELEVMGIPSDACKVKFQASNADETGSYTQWDRAATLATSIAVITYAVIKFSVFPDKSSNHPLHCHTVPLASMRSGYQHVYFNDLVLYESFHPAPSLFIYARIKGSDVVVREEEAEIVHTLCVKLSVKENMEASSVMLTLNEPILCEELVARVIQKAGLEGKHSDYSLYQDEQLVKSSSVLEANTNDLEMKDASPLSLPQLAMVPIYYSDLPGVDCEFITLFADVSTTAMDLIAGSVARLGNELAKVYPHMIDTEDEEKLHELFCFVYASNQDDTLWRQKVLKPDTLILDLFTDPSSDVDPCLLLHTKEQEHQLMDTAPALAIDDDAPISPDIVDDIMDGEDSDSHWEDGNRPTNIRHISPEVAQRNLEEYFKNVKLRVYQEQIRHMEGKGYDTHDQERRGKYHSVYGECFVEEDQDQGAVGVPCQSSLQQPKVKKSKRWFKKFGSHSVEYGIGQQGHKTTESFDEEKKVLKSPKSKKRWSFGSRGAHKREVVRSHSLHCPSQEQRRNTPSIDSSSDKCSTSSQSAHP